MLRRIESLRGFTLAARDGDIGRCKDFLFDDRDWAVRYMVAKTGGWLTGHEVLISPVSLQQPAWSTDHFPVDLTKEQIEQAPPLEKHAPVSRTYEMAYHEYYSLPFYWVGADLWGAYPDPAGMIHPVPDAPPETQAPPEDIDPAEGHLRSCEEVIGYDIRSSDGSSESIADMLLDDRSWALRFLVVDTRTWLPGGKVVIPTADLADVDWVDRWVTTGLSEDQIKHSPAFDADQLSDPDYEQRLHDYYGRQRP